MLELVTTCEVGNLEIGGLSSVELLDKLHSEAGITVNGNADVVMRHANFVTAPETSTITVATFTPRLLGCKSPPTLRALLDRERLAKLSAEHAVLLKGSVIDLLPAEAGPRIRLTYRDQPRGETLLVAMEPILDVQKIPTIFMVFNSSERPHEPDLWLRTSHLELDDEVPMDTLIAYWIREKTQ